MEAHQSIYNGRTYAESNNINRTTKITSNVMRGALNGLSGLYAFKSFVSIESLVDIRNGNEKNSIVVITMKLPFSDCDSIHFVTTGMIV